MFYWHFKGRVSRKKEKIMKRILLDPTCFSRRLWPALLGGDLTLNTRWHWGGIRWEIQNLALFIFFFVENWQTLLNQGCGRGSWPYNCGSAPQPPFLIGGSQLLLFIIPLNRIFNGRREIWLLQRVFVFCFFFLLASFPPQPQWKLYSDAEFPLEVHFLSFLNLFHQWLKILAKYSPKSTLDKSSRQ